MILFLSTADTEILALRAAIEMLPEGFGPVRAGSPAALDTAPGLDGVDAVVVRLLGGRRAWEQPFDALASACAERRVPLLAFGGEAALDPELTAASTVPTGVIASAFAYLLHGGPANTANLLRFLADEVLGADPPHGYAPPEPVPDEGIYRGGPDDPGFDPARPTVGIVFYRAHLLAGNTTFVDDLCDALRERGATPLPAGATRSDPTSGATYPCSPATSKAGSTPSSPPCWPWARLGATCLPHDPTPGTCRPWPASTCRSCRPSPPPEPESLGGQRRRPVTARHRLVGGAARVRRPHHLGPVVVQGDRRRRRRSRRAGRGLPDGARPGRRVAGTAVRLAGLRRNPNPARRSPSSCRPTRRSGAGSATPSGSTPPPRSSTCSTPCATPATGSTTSPPTATPSWPSSSTVSPTTRSPSPPPSWNGRSAQWTPPTTPPGSPSSRNRCGTTWSSSGANRPARSTSTTGPSAWPASTSATCWS